MELELTIDQFTAAPAFDSFESYLRHVASHAGLGYTLEFGVYHGNSLRVLCGCRDHVFGFDSFAGLPEAWNFNPGVPHDAGFFGHPNWQKAKWPGNSTLVVGLFADTLPRWLAEHDGPAALIHIDSDIYRSAADVLTLLNDRIIPGTVIAFDELSDWQANPLYLTWQEHEWRALNEWLHQYDRRIVPLARTNRYQAALRVTQ